MELALTTATGKESTKTVSVSDDNFAREFNEALVHQAVTAYLAGARSGTRAQKTRSDVRGGGAKPFRQKGTGRARAGTIRSPLWRGGGQTFAARPQEHSQKINKKMYRVAMRSILSELVRQERLIVIDAFTVDEIKTKVLVDKLNKLNLLKNVLIVTENVDDKLFKSARNLPHVGLCEAGHIDPVALIGNEKILMTVGAIKKIEESLS